MKNSKILVSSFIKQCPIYTGSEILNTRSKYNQNRPLLIKTNNQKIKEIYEERKIIYKLAHHKIICDKLDKKEIVKKIIELYELQ